MKYDDFATEFLNDNFSAGDEESSERTPPRYDERGRRIDGHRDWRSE